MRRLYDFECKNSACGEIFEELVYSHELEIQKCPICDSPSRRLIGTPRIDPRLGLDPAFSTMGDKWAKIRRQRKQIESKRESE